jgi:hypothetical protein
LYSVPGEPRDIDKKGVAETACATCHATLDPLSYSFAYYYGAGGVGGFGSYDRGRPENYLGANGATQAILDDWYNNPPVPHFLGKPLPAEYTLPPDTSSLVIMAREAAKSDLFARHITRLIVREAIGSEPEPRDLEEFSTLWRSFRTNNFSVDRMCHALIDTRMFGGPQ